MKIYLAGPDVFLQDAVDVGRVKVEICARHGLTGLYPLNNKVNLESRSASRKIFRGNEAMMDDAKAIIANLTPFRGPSADVGTVYELGYMAGSGKLCLGYSNDPSLYVERVAKFNRIRKRGKRLADSDDLTVENFDLPDNLMIVHALNIHGCPLIVPKQASKDTWYDLASFEACVLLAARRLRGAPKSC
jgi:nucleoside 2-deoxyribosyltransferase